MGPKCFGVGSLLPYRTVILKGCGAVALYPHGRLAPSSRRAIVLRGRVAIALEYRGSKGLQGRRPSGPDPPPGREFYSPNVLRPRPPVSPIPSGDVGL